MGSRFPLALAASLALATAVGTSAYAKSNDYLIYEVFATNGLEAQRLADSPFSILGENIVIGKNQVGIRRGEELRLATLRLRTKFMGVYTPQLPDPNADADYRTQWLTYDQIMAEWDAMLASYPWLMTKKAIGSTREGRTIYAYRMFRPEASDVLNPPKSILILGDTHAREWMSPSVVLHLGKKLIVELAGTDSPFTDRLVDKVGVWFVPVYNVDGYIYSWTTGNRLWRKNRRNNGGNVYGVDLNRNYEKGWGGAGSSGTPSSDTYRGPSAASEPETQAIRAFTFSLPNLIGMIDYHSYAGDILFPWSYTTTPPPPTALAMFTSVGNAVRDAIIAFSGSTYVVGQGSTTLYVASGTSKDWYFDQFLCPSYTIEVIGTSFDPPTSTITPTQDDNWVGFRAFIEAVAP